MPSAKYLLKTDDDVIINSNVILNKLQATPSMQVGIYGMVDRKSPRVVSRKSKWFTTKKEYPGTIYPDFCRGFAYLVSTQWVPNLYKATETERFLWLDDVYVTGILAEKASVPRYELSEYLQYLMCWQSEEEEKYHHDLSSTSIVVHQQLYSAELWWQIWCRMSGSVSNVSNCHDYTANTKYQTFSCLNQ